MKLVSYNMQYGFGQDGQYDLGRIAPVVAGADIIALQEVEQNWRRTGYDDQPALLSKLLPEYYYVYGPGFDMDASSFENGRVINQRRQFGTMILSRQPIVWSRLHLLPMRRMVNPLNTQSSALECLIHTPCGPIRFFSIHLAHIGAEERLEQIDFLRDRHNRATMEGGPWSGIDDEPGRDWTHGDAEPECPAEAIWMGDFNSEASSAEYRRITGVTPYHPGATYYGGFTDAARAAGVNAGSIYTHITPYGVQTVKRRLDYCFVSSTLASRVQGFRVDTEATASDHLPVWTEIDLETPGTG